MDVSFPEDFFILVLSLGVVVRYHGKLWDNLDRHIRRRKPILSEVNDGSATAVTEDLENIKVGDCAGEFRCWCVPSLGGFRQGDGLVEAAKRSAELGGRA